MKCGSIALIEPERGHEIRRPKVDVYLYRVLRPAGGPTEIVEGTPAELAENAGQSPRTDPMSDVSQEGLAGRSPPRSPRSPAGMHRPAAPRTQLGQADRQGSAASTAVPAPCLHVLLTR